MFEDIDIVSTPRQKESIRRVDFSSASIDLMIDSRASRHSAQLQETLLDYSRSSSPLNLPLAVKPPLHPRSQCPKQVFSAFAPLLTQESVFMECTNQSTTSPIDLSLVIGMDHGFDHIFHNAQLYRTSHCTYQQNLHTLMTQTNEMLSLVEASILIEEEKEITAAIKELTAEVNFFKHHCNTFSTMDSLKSIKSTPKISIPKHNQQQLYLQREKFKIFGRFLNCDSQYSEQGCLETRQTDFNYQYFDILKRKRQLIRNSIRNRKLFIQNSCEESVSQIIAIKKEIEFINKVIQDKNKLSQEKKRSYQLLQQDEKNIMKHEKNGKKQCSNKMKLLQKIRAKRKKMTQENNF